MFKCDIKIMKPKSFMLEIGNIYYNTVEKQNVIFKYLKNM